MDDLRESLVRRCRPPLAEGATHVVVASSVPGLKWETTKEDGGYTIRVMHAKSNKLLWTTNVDRIPKEKLDTSIRSLARIWKDSGVDWDVDEKELSSTKGLGSVVSGIQAAADRQKKPITHNDQNEPLLGKLVYFEARKPTMDRSAVFQRMDEARVGKPRVAKGFQAFTESKRLTEKECATCGKWTPRCTTASCPKPQCVDCFNKKSKKNVDKIKNEPRESGSGDYEPGCSKCGKQAGVKDGVCKDCRDVASLDDSCTDLKAEGVNLENYAKPAKMAEPPAKDSDDLHTADGINTDPENPDAEGQKADPLHKKGANESEGIIKRAPDGKFGSGPNGGMPKPKGQGQATGASGNKARLMGKIAAIGKQQGLPEVSDDEQKKIDAFRKNDSPEKKADDKANLDAHQKFREGGHGGNVKKTDQGYQVYVNGPKGEIPQGSPHKDQAAADKDLKDFDESGLPPSEYYAQKGKTHPSEKGKGKKKSGPHVNESMQEFGSYKDASLCAAKTPNEFRKILQKGQKFYCVDKAGLDQAKRQGGFHATTSQPGGKSGNYSATKMESTYNQKQNAYLYESMGMQRVDEAAIRAGARRDKIIASATNIVVYSEYPNGFSGDSVDKSEESRLRSKMKEKVDRGARLTKEAKGYHITVHANLWYEFQSSAS